MMSKKGLLDSLQDIVSDKKHAELEDCDSLKCILKKLKKSQHELKEKIADEKHSSERKQLKKQLLVVRAQRKKGLSLLKKMKK